MFYTIRPPPALLQVRCRDMTNVRIKCIYKKCIWALNAFLVYKMHVTVRNFCMHPDSAENKKGPKTDLDKKFLYVVEQAMSLRGIQSDRAMSIELDRHPNFINRVRNGLQSAPPDAWDTLFAKFPAARNFSTTNVIIEGGAQATTGTVEGDVNYTMNDCRRELEAVRQQLVDKDKLIAALERNLASQEEILSLLRGGSNRPN